MQTAAHPHIECDDDGARFSGTRFRIVHVVLERNAGRSIAQIQAAHPELTLAQIHSALAYYYDHQIEIDEQIARDEVAFDRAAAQLDPAIRVKLNAEREKRAATP